MKVLFYTKKIFEPEGNLFIRDRSGIALFVHDIAKSLQNDVDLYVLTSIPCKGTSVEKIHYVRYSKKDLLSCCAPNSIIRGIIKAIRMKGSIRNKLKMVYWEIDKNYFKKAVKREDPDLVHIHGLTMNIFNQLDVCRDLGIPCIVTLHGLIGLDESVDAPEELKRLEKEFIQYADKNNIPVTVISTGILKRVEEIYLGHKSSNIFVVLNATNTGESVDKNNSEESYSLRNQFCISTETKICLAIGSVCVRKNQIQIVEAYKQSDKLKSSSHLFLCGVDRSNGEVEQYINSCGLQDCVHLLGFVENKVVRDYLRQANLNIVASKSEGFGLSMIEAFAEGVPTVTFDDLEAVPDLYDDKTMLLAKGRSTSELSDAIEQALDQDWDHEYIKEYAKKFSLENMASEYLQIYMKVLAESN